MPVATTFFADLICPFCCLAAGPLGRLRAERLVELRFRPFEIHPETPKEGVPLKSFGAAKVDALYREVGWLANEAGVEIRRPDRLPNSRLGLEAVEMARAAKGESGAVEYAGRAMAAYFKDGLELGDEAVLRGMATVMGIARDLQDRCFLARGFRGAVDAARAEAEDALVTAVPAMRVGEFPVVGYQPYAQLKKLVERATRRTS